MAKKRANGEGNIRKRKDGRWEGKGEKIVQLYNEKLQLIPISNKQAVIIEDSNNQIKDAK